jgi:hypothetical protein
MPGRANLRLHREEMPLATAAYASSAGGGERKQRRRDGTGAQRRATRSACAFCFVPLVAVAGAVSGSTPDGITAQRLCERALVAVCSHELAGSNTFLAVDG